MDPHANPQRKLPRAQILANRAFATIERFLHIESVSGFVLLAVAALALIWANFPGGHSYHDLWHTPLTIGIGSCVFERPLHFWVNDALMTLFFLVVGMEIRREIHEGALSEPRQAILPLAAALGGVVAPALIYASLNATSAGRNGWAVPTATDIAFALGVLALLGRTIPANVRIFLLALAIIDDIIAVLIIAIFYSEGVNFAGIMIACISIFLVVGLQRAGFGAAYAYVFPGAVMWFGLLKAGVHPTLAGVVLGLMTPVTSTPMRENARDIVSRVAIELDVGEVGSLSASHHLRRPAKALRIAQRELLPPVVRVQAALHPWVAYGIMPLFALANAGVSLDGIDLTSSRSLWVAAGVGLALCIGKPLGIVTVTWVLVRIGCCRLPAGVTWAGATLVGLLAGIGFTMSIFIAMLAFADEGLREAAKLGVLAGSGVAALFGLSWGWIYARRARVGTSIRPKSASDLV